MKKLKAMLSLATALMVASSLLILASCQKPQGNATKTFDIEYIKIYEETVKNNNVTIAGHSPKNVAVKVNNTKKFVLHIGERKFDANNGEALAKNVEIPKGNYTLTLTLKAEGFKDEEINVAVERKDSLKSFKVEVVVAEGIDPAEVLDGDKIDVATDSPEVVVTASAVMTKVMIGNKEANLKSSGKTAVANVDNGNIEVSVTFADYDSKTFSFTTKKVDATELPVRCTSVKLVTEAHAEGVPALKFNSNRELKWEAKEGDIQFSYVTVEMEFDAEIQKPTIRCKDERSANYSTAPTAKDMKGIFSGYIVKEIDSGTESELEIIDGKKYTQMFVVGAGKVEYELDFAVSGRKTTTYKIVINNKNEKKFKVVIENDDLAPPLFPVFDALGGNGIPGNVSPCLPLPFYHKGPLFDPNNEETNAFVYTPDYSELEAIYGKLRFILQRNGKDADEYEKNGGMYFYAATSPNEKSCHEFTRFNSRVVNDIVDLIKVDVDVSDKYFDGLVAFKNELPQGIYPGYTGKKWTSATEGMGLCASIAQFDAKKGRPEAHVGSGQVWSYRENLLYVKKAEPQHDGNTDKLSIWKNMEWTGWYFGDKGKGKNGKAKNTSELTPVLKNDGKDFLMLSTPGMPNDKFKDGKVKWTIKKGTESSSLSIDSDWNQKDGSALLTGFGYLLIPGVNTGTELDTCKSAYKFQKDHIYEVTVDVETNSGKKYKYIYSIDYKDAQKHELELNSLDGDSSSDLFGVPTSYSSLLMPRLKCADPTWNKFIAK